MNINFISKNTRQATLFDMRQRTEVTIIFNLLIRTNIVLAVTDCHVPIFSKKTASFNNFDNMYFMC